VWPVMLGTWNVTCRPIGTSISPPWLAAPDVARGGTGGGTGPKAHCSPLPMVTDRVMGGRAFVALDTAGRAVSPCRRSELARVPAVDPGRRSVPPAGAHSRRSHRVPGRERPPVCGAWVAPPPSRGSLTPRLSLSMRLVPSAGDGGVVATRHPARNAPHIRCAMSLGTTVLYPSAATRPRGPSCH
jgi:hypothetical protein